MPYIGAIQNNTKPKLEVKQTEKHREDVPTSISEIKKQLQAIQINNQQNINVLTCDRCGAVIDYKTFTEPDGFLLCDKCKLQKQALIMLFMRTNVDLASVLGKVLR